MTYADASSRPPVESDLRPVPDISISTGPISKPQVARVDAPGRPEPPASPEPPAPVPPRLEWAPPNAKTPPHPALAPLAEPRLAWDRKERDDADIERRLDRLERMIESLVDHDGGIRPKRVRRGDDGQDLFGGDAPPPADVLQMPVEPGQWNSENLAKFHAEADRAARMAAREVERANREAQRAIEESQRSAALLAELSTKDFQSMPNPKEHRKALQVQREALRRQLEAIEWQLRQLEDQGDREGAKIKPPKRPAPDSGTIAPSTDKLPAVSR